MAAEINELFEEGVTRCGELTDAADEAMNAVDATAGQARELAERVREEAAEAREHLRDLATRLTKAAEAIGESTGEAQGALDGLAGRSADLKADIGELLERVRQAASQVDEQKARLDHSLDAQTTEAQGDVTELARKTQEMEAEAARRLEEAGPAIAAFRATIDAARAELMRKREGWNEALERLEGSAQEQANACVTGLQQVLERQTTAIVNAINAMVDRHNDTMEVIKQEFVEQGPQDLAGALEPVEATLRALGEAAGGREDALAARLADLEAALEAQGAPLTELQTAFDSATRLE